MCRRSRRCSELPDDQAHWSRLCPLPPPAWFDEQLDRFTQAVHALAVDDRASGREALIGIRGDAMAFWCAEHGQMSGMHRVRILARAEPSSIPIEERDPRRSPRKFQREVFARDGYRCRYCGTRLIAQKVLARVGRVLDDPELSDAVGKPSIEGIIHAFKPVVDHVIPWRLGGRTEPGNLVASCGPCNYGKSHYTLEQMAVEDPLLRAPTRDAWDGLRAYAEVLG